MAVHGIAVLAVWRRSLNNALLMNAVPIYGETR
jgi:hypothetical protein